MKPMTIDSYPEEVMETGFLLILMGTYLLPEEGTQLNWTIRVSGLCGTSVPKFPYLVKLALFDEFNEPVSVW